MYQFGHDFLAVSPVSCLQAVAVALYNPEAFRTLGQVRLDVGRVLPEHMTDEAYRELLVCLLSSLYIHKLCTARSHHRTHAGTMHLCTISPKQMTAA